MSSTRQDPSQGPLAPHTPLNRPTESPACAEPAVIDLSVIVPAKNEAASLGQLVREAVESLRGLAASADRLGHRLRGFEVLIVDDGSSDESPRLLRQLMDQYPELRVLRLVRNAGQSAATAEGFRAARGNWVAILDADLQNPPAELVKLWQALPGYDAALGWRMKRRDVWTKRIVSKLANQVRHWVLGDTVRDTGCAVRIFPRAAALRLPMFHGAHRFYGPLLMREGCRIVQVPVEHRPRPHGHSHYNFWNRSLNVLLDLLGVAWLMRRPLRCELDPAFGSGVLTSGSRVRESKEQSCSRV